VKPERGGAVAAIPILIDTDPGVDDAVAILLALASPELEVRAVTAVAGNVPLDDTARNARKVCELAGRPDVAVHAGCRKPLLRSQIFGKYASGGGLAGDTLPAPAMPLRPQHAVDVLVSELGRAAGGETEKITVCTLGPLTNLAWPCPQPVHRAGIEQIDVMGGALRRPGQPAQSPPNSTCWPIPMRRGSFLPAAHRSFWYRWT